MSNLRDEPFKGFCEWDASLENDAKWPLKEHLAWPPAASHRLWACLAVAEEKWRSSVAMANLMEHRVAGAIGGGIAGCSVGSEAAFLSGGSSSSSSIGAEVEAWGQYQLPETAEYPRPLP